MSDFGITPGGFVVKPLQDILNDKAALAQAAFGPDVDLRSTSALRKLLDVSSAEDLELWKLAEALYYSSFLSTASGTALDLLGDDLGVARRFLTAQGAVTFTLSGQTPGRTYNLPPGTLVETDAPVQRFRTLAAVALSDQATTATAAVEATARGPAGNVAAGAINKINAAFAQVKLSLGAAQVAVNNANPTTGGTSRRTTTPTGNSCSAGRAPSGPCRRCAAPCWGWTASATAGCRTRSAGWTCR